MTRPLLVAGIKEPNLISAQDYYPFGMIQPGRNVSSASYCYGFNGKENDNEIKGSGNSIDLGARMYDSRLGRFLSTDPLEENFAWNSPYSYAENDVIRSTDLDGLEKLIYIYNFTAEKLPKPNLNCQKPDH